MKKNNKTWLITGCSSGLGRAFAQEVLKNGYNAVVTSRNLKDIQDIIANYPETALGLALDITNKEQVKNVVKQAKEKFKNIDVLVNNAGYGYRAAVEEAEDKAIRQLFDTNFFGTVNMIQAVLPNMRQRKSGTIFNLSSIAGRFAAPGSAFYAASKFAIEGMSDALRQEVGPLGIRIIVVEPGAFRTDFAGRSLKGTQTEITDYKETAGKRRKENDHTHGTQPGAPDKAAKVVVQIEQGEDVPFHLLLGSDAVQLVTEELKKQNKELTKWKNISIGTDY